MEKIVNPLKKQAKELVNDLMGDFKKLSHAKQKSAAKAIHKIAESVRKKKS